MAKMADLIDSFNDNSRDTTKWPTFGVGGMTWVEGNGQVTVTPQNPTVASDDCYLQGDFYDLTGSYASIRILNVPISTNDITYALLSLQQSGATNRLEYLIWKGTVYPKKVVSGTGTDLTSFAYDPTQHKWFKISESGGNCTWWTSANGIDWVSQITVANPITVTALAPTIEVITWAAGLTNVGTFEYDNFNTGMSDKPSNYLEYIRVGNGMSRSEMAN